ncbi:hypothetical protein QJS66_15425 [Kocuria rhizophila]|nr:hypothetical protein QJS66_15425 [Kocuria rhizophila]
MVTLGSGVPDGAAADRDAARRPGGRAASWDRATSQGGACS